MKRFLRVVITGLLMLFAAETVMPEVAEARPRRRGATAQRRARKGRRVVRRCRRQSCRRRGARRAAPAPASNKHAVIDVSDQRLYLYQGGALVGVHPVSTGSGRRYFAAGRWRVADTPLGTWRVYRRIPGRYHSELGLGEMYYPAFYSGGFAIHGGRLPGYPASHGCVRVPMGAAQGIFDWLQIGTPVTARS